MPQKTKSMHFLPPAAAYDVNRMIKWFQPFYQEILLFLAEDGDQLPLLEQEGIAVVRVDVKIQGAFVAGTHKYAAHNAGLETVDANLHPVAIGKAEGSGLGRGHVQVAAGR